MAKTKEVFSRLSFDGAKIRNIMTHVKSFLTFCQNYFFLKKVMVILKAINRSHQDHIELGDRRLMSCMMSHGDEEDFRGQDRSRLDRASWRRTPCQSRLPDIHENKRASPSRVKPISQN